ncbi:MAG TPA: GNAT family N-acetyltransferase [Noviherbaspirillum sp.]|uniref:GNAT family N-acetyltransferase n=1 Tax=Noviherbaspirillum sp. TaxID=1926288 RepID=UPI002B45AA7C|nr:GNAT family N-acetyltransferase [Noviherbaspirillum sp.]HJV84327.1 GNAT family N-acetyltransferase [Noviherbaspirillum sp.]
MWSFLPFPRCWKQTLRASTPASGLPSALHDSWRLRDGTTATLRAARESDGEMMQAFVHGLSMESRYHRFFYPVHELTPTMLDRFTHNTPTSAMTLLVVIQGQGREQLIAMGQYVADTYPARCEFAVVVGDDWQRHGLGTRLIQALVCLARAAGFERIEGDILAENRAMLRLMPSLGFSLMRHQDGAYLVKARKVLDVPAWKCSPLAEAERVHGRDRPAEMIAG